MVKSSIFKYVQQNVKYITNIYFAIELQRNLNYVYIDIHILYTVFYILLYIFKNTAFNHPPLFYTSYSSRLVTFHINNLEF